VLQSPSKEPKNNPGLVKITNFKQRQSDDALELAQLVYDVFKEYEAGGIIAYENNNAEQN
jgi:hypothetical protein